MISVIILNWNGRHHLDECLTSVTNQTYKDYEVIVADNCSTDGSQDFIKENFPSVILLCLDQNYGFCKGNNEGIRISKGEYVVLLNNDTRVEHKWLENLYNCINSDPQLGFCASKLLSYYDNSLVDAVGDGYSICGAGFKRGYMEEASSYCEDEYVFGACAGAAIYKKEMLDKIGLLDEDFYIAYEDSDLSFRAQLAGYKCKFASNAVVYHKINASLGKLSKIYVFFGHRNDEYGYFKNMPSRLIRKTILRHLAYDMIAFGYFMLKGRGILYLKAKIDFLRNFRKTMNKRKDIQKLKIVSDDYIWNMLEKQWLKTRVKGKKI